MSEQLKALPKTGKTEKLMISPIVSAVFALAAAVLYYIFPTYVQRTKEEEFVLAGIALGCGAVSFLVFLFSNLRFFKSKPSLQKICGHLLTLVVLLLILIFNLIKFIKAFSLEFVPVMRTNTAGIWMLVLSGLLVVGAILHPRKKTEKIS